MTSVLSCHRPVLIMEKIYLVMAFVNTPLYMITSCVSCYLYFPLQFWFNSFIQFLIKNNERNIDLV